MNSRSRKPVSLALAGALLNLGSTPVLARVVAAARAPTGTVAAAPAALSGGLPSLGAAGLSLSVSPVGLSTLPSLPESAVFEPAAAGPRASFAGAPAGPVLSPAASPAPADPAASKAAAAIAAPRTAGPAVRATLHELGRRVRGGMAIGSFFDAGAPFSANAADATVPADEGRELPPALGRLSPRRRSAENTRLGPIDDPAEALDGKTFSTTEWHYLMFRFDGDLGEPTIDGKPNLESDLEFKRAGRAYSFLALGKTPSGDYRVAFPNGPAFTVRVDNRDASTPEQRLAGAKSIAKEVFSKEDPPLEFAPSVPERLRDYFESHYRFMERQLNEYYDYFQEDPELDDEARSDKLHELQALAHFYHGVFEGRENDRDLASLIAQLAARERAILDDYAEYVKADPSKGRTAVELHLRMLEQYRSMRGELLQALSSVRGEPSAFVKVLAWIWSIPTRIRIAWMRRTWFR